MNAWDRREGEPSLWYNRFDMFYRPFPERTLLAAYNRWRAKHGQNKQPGKSPASAWSRAFNKWGWKKRAEAWDDHLADQRRAEEQEERNVAREERKGIIRTLKAELVVFLNENRDKLLASRDPSLHEVVRFVETVLREERIELGDEVHQIDITSGGDIVKVLGVDLSKLL